MHLYTVSATPTSRISHVTVVAGAHNTVCNLDTAISPCLLKSGYLLTDSDTVHSSFRFTLFTPFLPDTGRRRRFLRSAPNPNIPLLLSTCTVSVRHSYCSTAHPQGQRAVELVLHLRSIPLRSSAVTLLCNTLEPWRIPLPRIPLHRIPPTRIPPARIPSLAGFHTLGVAGGERLPLRDRIFLTASDSSAVTVSAVGIPRELRGRGLAGFGAECGAECDAEFRPECGAG